MNRNLLKMRKKEKDKKEFRELKSIMNKMKNKTATPAERKKYATLRETVTGKVGGDKAFIKKVKTKTVKEALTPKPVKLKSKKLKRTSSGFKPKTKLKSKNKVIKRNKNGINEDIKLICRNWG